MLIGYAALSFAIAPASRREIQLLPAGPEFRSRDGRPKGISGWKIDAAIAERVIARATTQKTPFVIDYEHQTLAAEFNGKDAPASGWFEGARLEWREGQGLYAVDVAWTAKAKAHIDADEYRFISPVFSYDPKTGEVLQMQMAALTNNPGLDGMNAVTALATEFFNRSQEPIHRKDQDMKAIAILLGLPEDASEADINAAVVALKAKLAENEGAVATLKAETAALKTQSPDPAKYVPIETVTQLRTDFAALTARFNDGELDTVIQGALDEGKLLPAMEGWARDLGKSDLAALKSFIEKTPAIEALKGTQTRGLGPGGAGGAIDDATSTAVMKALGQTPEQFAAGKIKED